MGLGFTMAGGNDALYSLLAQRRAAQIQAALEERARADKLQQQDVVNNQRNRQLDLQEQSMTAQKPRGPVTLGAGQSLVDPETGRIITSMPEKASAAPRLMNVQPGGTIYDPDKGAVFTSPFKPQQEPAPHYQLQPEVDPKTGAQTGRFLGYNPKTNGFEPVGGTTPASTKPAPGAAQAVQHEQAKKDAMGSLDQLDQSIDAASSLIGPGPGRISHLEQLVGNPDPKISALGTKLLLTKMQVDHAATGTVRAGASPQLLARWDNLLSQNLDAANLKAAVQAMREILGGGSAPNAGGEWQDLGGGIKIRKKQ